MSTPASTARLGGPSAPLGTLLPVDDSGDMSVDDRARASGRTPSSSTVIPRAVAALRDPVGRCGLRVDDETTPDLGGREVLHDPQPLLRLLPRDHLFSVETESEPV
jgi:hypothetical protein